MPCLVDNNAIGLKAIQILCNDLFLYYFLNRIKLENYSRATTVPSVRKSDIDEIKFPIPSLSEQRAIAAKIEQLFSELDSGVENLKKAQAQLKVYRQAVLKWAFEGKLTEEWRKKQKDLPTAETLLAQIKTECEKKAEYSVKKAKSIAPITSEELAKLPQLANGWKWVKSGELYSFVTSGSRGWAQYYSESGAIFIRITNLDFDSIELDLKQDKIKYVNPPKGVEGKRTKVEEGDFLFSITGYLGMFAIAPKLDDAYVNQHVSLCRPTNGFNKKFFGYWAIAKSGGNYYINQLQKGATKAGLGLDDIQNFPVPFCSLKEQNQIVQDIEDRLSVCDKLEETIAQSLQKAESLRQSILKKAFEGKLLTKTELEEVRKAPDWEPAEKLLQRIKKEKENEKG
jgi:type I restriction enzyme S subunit